MSEIDELRYRIEKLERRLAALEENQNSRGHVIGPGRFPPRGHDFPASPLDPSMAKAIEDYKKQQQIP